MNLTLGILICDSVNPSLEPIAGDYRAMFGNLFRTGAPDGVDVKLRFYTATAREFPERLDECDGYLTSGSAASVNDEQPWIADLERFVQRLHQAEAKLFAICFGHQMIARALGGRVEVSGRGWGVGVQEVEVTKTEPWMIPRTSTLRILSSHQEQIAELPPGAEVLASTPHCPVWMMRCGSLIGVQGHPEFCKPYASALLDTRTAIIPAETREAAVRSFEIETDSRILVSWILHYQLSIP
jgi:GMP synthase-like glutamine amidotransferase